MHQLIRRAAATTAAIAFVISVPSAPRAQAVPAIDKRITYILPQWSDFQGATMATIAQQTQELRSRIGEGPRVKVGFTVYVHVSMGAVDPGNTPEIRAALAPTYAQIDSALTRARAAQIPICLSFVTAIRADYDLLQIAAQAEDRRNMQWHSDGSLATWWTTLSRYARKQEAMREAHIRELGRFLAMRMLQYPDTLVAATGDAEIELSFERSAQFGHAPDVASSLIADYSPFAILEFRDWLRGTGLYAPGQPFFGEAYRNSARYTSDASIATLSTDFGQNFSTWNLKHFDWSLSDPTSPDPNAIPETAYNATGWNAMPGTIGGGFDAPRVHQLGNAYSDLWDEFRQTMVWRHNLAFAKWITTSPDISTGATVPADRWFSDQVPADYLFGNTPALPDFRLDTSASPHWTADVSPYGSMGITAFNQFNQQFGIMHKTLTGVAPLIAQRKVRWGVFEWNPSVPANPDITIYRDEMALVERYRPSVLAPSSWQSSVYQLENTGFETALKELVDRIKVIPLTLSRTALVAAATSTGASVTPPQTVRVGGAPGETPPWTLTAASPFLDVRLAADGRSFTVAPKPQAYAPGTQGGSVTLSSSDPGYSPVTLNVTLNVAPAGASTAPIGSFDTPAEGAAVSGEVGVTGWAVDDIGIVGVDIYRDPVAGEPAALVRLGSATLVPGARPDVLAAFPGQPLSEQAGWGYMLLSNFLPNQGNGTFKLHAIARDAEGHTVTLGTRIIVCQNATAVLPFGTIDTPGQGETVSGTITNFGWALSPNLIAPDGSTIGIYIDNVFVGRPSYGHARADIAALFPGYPNTSDGNGAIGFFQIDTTQYANGVHTIAWVVVDSAGRAQGIGSRYFTIANP